MLACSAAEVPSMADQGAHGARLEANGLGLSLGHWRFSAAQLAETVRKVQHSRSLALARGEV